MTAMHETTNMVSGFRESRFAIACLAGMIVGAIFFLWISYGTQFHQLAIGTLLATVTFTLALALFELCWRLGLLVAGVFVSGDDAD